MALKSKSSPPPFVDYLTTLKEAYADVRRRWIDFLRRSNRLDPASQLLQIQDTPLFAEQSILFFKVQTHAKPFNIDGESSESVGYFIGIKRSYNRRNVCRF
jgi:hypothetical protein